jgi:transcriptional regulator with XRE-family HTH domain
VTAERSNLFGALLRYWRNARGLSQLDLAATADVSARHLSFLETGRSRPSREMVLQLASTLDVPLREQNALLRAAGFSDQYTEPGLGEAQDPLLRSTVERMLAQQEPYPLVVMNSYYDVLQMNHGAQRLFAYVLGERVAQVKMPLNALQLLFDPNGLRPLMPDWSDTAKHMLQRLQRESMQQPANMQLKQLHSSLCSYPDVPPDWRSPDLTAPNSAALSFGFELDGTRYSFLTALTVFNTAQNITAEELRIESYFPLDPQTEQLCRKLAG